MTPKRKPKLSVWKFASCDGCQLSLLDCEDELLAVAGELEIAYFVEASRAMVKGPYDLTLVDGSLELLLSIAESLCSQADLLQCLLDTS